MTRSLRRAWPFTPDPDVGSVTRKHEVPRCGQPVRGYEAVWGALLDELACGRPAGHNGQHRSVQSLDRERSKKRWERYSEQRRQKRRRDKLARALRESDGYRRRLGRRPVRHPVFTAVSAVAAHPPAPDADDELSRSHVAAARNHGRIACLPCTHLFNGTHVTHYTHISATVR